MWSFLRAIPPDVCGANILTFLTYQSIVKLDVAIKIDSQRRIYWRMLAHAGPVMLSGKARQLPKVWQWFWCRKATIDSIDLVPEQAPQKIRLIQRHLSRIASGVNIRLSTIDNMEKFCEPARTIVADSQLCAKIICLCGYKVKDKTPLSQLFCAVTNLREVDFSTFTNCRSIIKLLENNRQLQKASCFWRNLPSTDMLQALVLSAEHLVDLYLEGTVLAVHIPILATLRWLRNISIAWEDQYEPFFTAVTLSPLAQGCTLLERIDVCGCAENALFPFVKHCPQLQDWAGSSNEALDGATLVAIAENCPHFTHLPDVQLAISVPEAHEYAAAFERLTTLGAFVPDGAHNNMQAALEAVASHLHNVAYLKLYGGGVHARCFRALAQFTENLCQLTVECSVGVDYRDAIIDVLRANRNLRELDIHDCAMLCDALIYALVEYCPKLETLQGAVDTDESFSSLIQLAQGCPRLLRVSTLSGPGVTDRAILTLGTHCKYLRDLNLGKCPSLTNTALVDLMVARPSLRSLYFTSSRDYTSLQWVLHTKGIKTDSFVASTGTIGLHRK